MIEHESFIADGMSAIRKAIADAPSHEEVPAAFEALLQHLSGVTKGEQAKRDEADAAEAKAAETVKAKADLDAQMKAKADEENKAQAAKLAAAPADAAKVVPTPTTTKADQKS